MPIKVGEKLPAVEVHENEPGNKVSMDQLFKGKKGVLFAVPGAFTPGCSKTHLPGFVEQAAELKSKGVQEVACVSINDAFVMAAWGKEHGAEGKTVWLFSLDRCECWLILLENSLRSYVFKALIFI
ncbi:unnamed protein product [Coregonus sp. 'balchen']|nr:unnamed protein product [Coregonus sp. 'balchen']